MAQRAFPVFQSASAAARISSATAFVHQFPPDTSITIVAASRGAADDFVRRIAAERGATFGLTRLSLTQLAARVSASHLAGRGIAPATPLAVEAVAARATFDALQGGELTYFQHVAAMPGFARGLAQTIGELRLAGASAHAVIGTGSSGEDLANLLRKSESELAVSSSADRAALFTAAASLVDADASLSAPLLLLDVPLVTSTEAAFAKALLHRASAACATLPVPDDVTRSALVDAGGEIRPQRERAVAGDLASVQQYLFASDAPPVRTPDGSLQFFSAPGEGRECVEIARRILEEAHRGIPFDEMAILVRSPQSYHGLLEAALQRAGVAAWFDRGTRRPHPAGRAFLALLRCAIEDLSARRFAEYLSLGEVPAPGDAPLTWVPSEDEAMSGASEASRASGAGEAGEASGAGENSGTATASSTLPAPLALPAPSTLPAPRHWERLIDAASVIAGANRWRRRLDGLRAEYEMRLADVVRKDGELPLVERIRLDIDRLDHLRAFALPLIDELAGWPRSAPWSGWLDRLEALAPRVLRRAEYVLRVLADLRPMGAIGPLSLPEVFGVLAERLATVDDDPPARRYGRVYVGTPGQARGRSFTVVFVPGLAERMFPQKPRQDPLLPDEARARTGVPLPGRDERGHAERLLLRLAVGAASDRLYLSYPRIEVAEARPRVPSFYAMDVMRAVTGRIPHHDQLEEEAHRTAAASLAWPAPASAARAIDDQEYDLAVLRELLELPDPTQVRGHAHFILRLNDALRRSVRERWARAERQWSPHDGLLRLTGATRGVLADHRLTAREYSLSALQRYATCPYQFLLGAILRLRPDEHPEPLQRLDPLTRGSIFHAMQAELFRTLREDNALPVVAGNVAAALERLDRVCRHVAARFEERLAPSIERVWRDEIAAIVRDLRVWLRRSAEDGGAWVPTYFELAFGLKPDDDHDAASVAKAVQVDGRFALRGSVDLVEEHATRKVLRVVDHKTGKNRITPPLTIGGGAVLQPVLYSLVVEAMTGREVVEGELSFCTQAGRFSRESVTIDERARRAGVEVLEVVDRAVQDGTFAAAPQDHACAWCDFRPVCGPQVAVRASRKPPALLADLVALRSRP